ncbi:MAG: GNAT family N-acetyltransferase [Candidatus Syntrophosphaera sp.]|nr:GNAT family N-acetyltransferase [Candidatus Syntrophosphaera sp.]
MPLPFNMNRMLDTELRFPQRFTNMTPKNYGMLFWNEGNKKSYDSNHAVITDHLGPESSIRDIEFFYKTKGIAPRIHQSYQARELEKIGPALENHGFKIETRDEQFFMHEHESTLRPVPELRIERLHHLSIDVMETIAIEFGGDWTIKVVERHLLHPSYHLLGGFIADELASLASVSVYAGYSRVDDVYTRDKFRGRGFGGAMIDYLVKYHNQLSENYLYLFSADPAAIRIYEKAGFTKLPQNFQCWSAWKEIQ